MENQALHIEGLSKTYKSGVVALKDISLTVGEGDFFGLLGPNGAGKTTLIGIVAGLVNETSGQAKLFGYDIRKQANMAKRQISLVPQEFNFYIFETVERILLVNAGYYGVVPRVAKSRAEYWLKALNLWGKRHAEARTLSGGMKRRLMIARAMMHNPRLLILDEPTAGVDIEFRRSMWEFLRQINRDGVTIILTTHYLEEAENLCKHIAIMDQGEIIENTDRRRLISKISKETFVLDLECPLVDTSVLRGMECKMIDEKTLEVELLAQQNINHLFSLLSERNIQVRSMKNKMNRLEQLFIYLTQENK